MGVVDSFVVFVVLISLFSVFLLFVVTVLLLWFIYLVIYVKSALLVLSVANIDILTFVIQCRIGKAVHPAVVSEALPSDSDSIPSYIGIEVLLSRSRPI